MLPDFFRMAGAPKHRARDVGSSEGSLSVGARALSAGARHHVDIDRWFHACEVFVGGEHALRRSFLLPSSPKLVLFAHAAWEMCLDGALLRSWSDGRPSDFARAPGALADVLAMADAEGFFAGVDDAAHATIVHRIERILGALADGRLYGDYVSPTGIAMRVAGIRAAFGLPIADRDTIATWADALAPFVDRAPPALEELVAARDRARAQPATLD